MKTLKNNNKNKDQLLFKKLLEKKFQALICFLI